MAVLRRIESAWRKASINAGFDEIDGPTFEHLDLYTVKSGEEIVSELFSFTRAGGDVEYALRPEFTPTLARMAASKGRSLALPTKWFAIPSHFRGERPQRGRLREFNCWNVDFLGMNHPSADAEVIATAIQGLANLGLTCDDVVVRISHREVVVKMLLENGIPLDKLNLALTLLDKREKMSPEIFAEKLNKHGLDATAFTQFDGDVPVKHEELATLQKELECMGYQLIGAQSISTSFVDLRITQESFLKFTNDTGERTGHCGRWYGMTILLKCLVDLRYPCSWFWNGRCCTYHLFLKTRGLLGDGTEYVANAQMSFVVSACDEGDALLASTISLQLSECDGIHARRSYKTTRTASENLLD